MQTRVIFARELKLGFRNPWAYTFTAVFSVFFLLVVMIGAKQNWQGFTFTTATFVNLMLYLLPLMALLMGSFSLATEREEGSWKLLMAYPLRSAQFILGKALGLIVVSATVVSFSIGLAITVGSIVGATMSLPTIAVFAGSAVGLIVCFTLLAMGIGSLARTRWQALAYSVGLWFVLVIAWPTILIGSLGFAPYLWIKPLMIVGFALNPAEWTRIVAIVSLGSGSILGPDYHDLVVDVQSLRGIFVSIGYVLLWMVVMLRLSIYIWEKGRYRD